MSEPVGRLYDFTFRGLLAEQALDRNGRRNGNHGEMLDAEIARALSIDSLDGELVAEARAMATVYTAIAAFENSVRKLIKTVLLEQKGENWWELSVSEKIRIRAAAKQKEEEKIRWHAQRGADPLFLFALGEDDALRRTTQAFIDARKHARDRVAPR